jgi:hypothetical protein
MIGEAFHRGGWGMIPTAIFGVLLIGAAILYAVKPDKRFVPLQFSLGILTLMAGSLGFVTGMIKSLNAIGEVKPEERFIWLIGMGESLNNIGLALMVVVLAALLASVGTLRIAFGKAHAS